MTTLKSLLAIALTGYTAESCPNKYSSLGSVFKEFSKPAKTTFRKPGAWEISGDEVSETTFFFLPHSKYGADDLIQFDTVNALFDPTSTNYQRHRLQPKAAGTALVVLNNRYVYYNAYMTPDIILYDLDLDTVVQKLSLPSGTNYHGTSEYSVGLQTDIDLARDKVNNAVWVMYTSERNNGNLVLSRLDELSLSIKNTYHTNYQKYDIENAFIICGVLYTVNPDGVINSSFDTETGMTRDLSVTLRTDPYGFQFTSMNYFPVDEKLYSWTDQGEAIKFSLDFVTPTTTPPEVITKEKEVVTLELETTTRNKFCERDGRRYQVEEYLVANCEGFKTKSQSYNQKLQCQHDQTFKLISKSCPARELAIFLNQAPIYPSLHRSLQKLNAYTETRPSLTFLEQKDLVEALSKTFEANPNQSRQTYKLFLSILLSLRAPTRQHFALLQKLSSKLFCQDQTDQHLISLTSKHLSPILMSDDDIWLRLNPTSFDLYSSHFLKLNCYSVNTDQLPTLLNDFTCDSHEYSSYCKESCENCIPQGLTMFKMSLKPTSAPISDNDLEQAITASENKILSYYLLIIIKVFSIINALAAFHLCSIPSQSFETYTWTRKTCPYLTNGFVFLSVFGLCFSQYEHVHLISSLTLAGLIFGRIIWHFGINMIQKRSLKTEMAKIMEITCVSLVFIVSIVLVSLVYFIIALVLSSISGKELEFNLADNFVAQKSFYYLVNSLNFIAVLSILIISKTTFTIYTTGYSVFWLSMGSTWPEESTIMIVMLIITVLALITLFLVQVYEIVIKQFDKSENQTAFYKTHNISPERHTPISQNLISVEKLPTVHPYSYSLGHKSASHSILLARNTIGHKKQISPGAVDRGYGSVTTVQGGRSSLTSASDQEEVVMLPEDREVEGILTRDVSQLVQANPYQSSSSNLGGNGMDARDEFSFCPGTVSTNCQCLHPAGSLHMGMQMEGREKRPSSGKTIYTLEMGKRERKYGAGKPKVNLSSGDIMMVQNSSLNL